MNKKKLQKLRQQLESMRARSANLRNQELVSLATSLGRYRFARGKEPTFVSELLPKSMPISIPNHSGNMPRFTAISILNVLEQDIDDLEETLPD